MAPVLGLAQPIFCGGACQTALVASVRSHTCQGLGMLSCQAQDRKISSKYHILANTTAVEAQVV